MFTRCSGSVPTPSVGPRLFCLLRQRDRRVYVSSIGSRELSIKYRIGKLPQAGPLLDTYYQTLTYGFLELPFYDSPRPA